MPRPIANSSSPWRNARRLRPLNVPPRILVAEDDPEMRKLIVESLREDGNDVQETPDGGRLLVELTHGTHCNYENVDLIVSDIRMPVCTGLQIVEALRAAHCAVPIVLMTAFGDDQTRAHAESLGAVLFDKPFALDDLRTAVLAMLAREHGPASPAVPANEA
jgi:CheY-like chemotaxis protein